MVGGDHGLHIGPLAEYGVHCKATTGGRRCWSSTLHYRPFRELDDAIGIAQDDWWMTDDRGQKVSFMKMWLDHVGDESFNLAAEPKARRFCSHGFPGSDRNRLFR